MNARPDRRRPGGRTPIQLVPQPEAVQIARAEPEEPVAAPVASPTTDPAASSSVAQAPTGAAASALAPSAAPVIDPARKVPTTLDVNLLRKKQAETAILRTAALEGGYRSWTQFIDGAIQHELERLAGEFNDGVPFEPNSGEFRRGRPFGS